MQTLAEPAEKDTRRSFTFPKISLLQTLTLGLIFNGMTDAQDIIQTIRDVFGWCGPVNEFYQCVGKLRKLGLIRSHAAAELGAEAGGDRSRYEILDAGVAHWKHSVQFYGGVSSIWAKSVEGGVDTPPPLTVVESRLRQRKRLPTDEEVDLMMSLASPEFEALYRCARAVNLPPVRLATAQIEDLSVDGQLSLPVRGKDEARLTVMIERDYEWLIQRVIGGGDFSHSTGTPLDAREFARLFQPHPHACRTAQERRLADCAVECSRFI